MLAARRQLSTGPFMPLLVVEPGTGAKESRQPVSLPGGRLLGEMAVRVKPALPVPGSRAMALGKQPPTPVSVWPCTPGRDTGAPETSPSLPGAGPPTAQTTLAGLPQPPAASPTAGRLLAGQEKPEAKRQAGGALGLRASCDGCDKPEVRWGPGREMGKSSPVLKQLCGQRLPVWAP